MPSRRELAEGHPVEWHLLFLYFITRAFVSLFCSSLAFWLFVILLFLPSSRSEQEDPLEGVPAKRSAEGWLAEGRPAEGVPAKHQLETRRRRKKGFQQKKGLHQQVAEGVSSRTGIQRKVSFFVVDVDVFLLLLLLHSLLSLHLHLHLLTLALADNINTVVGKICYFCQWHFQNYNFKNH